MRAGGRILMIFGLLLAAIAGVATFLILQSSPNASEEGAEQVIENVNVIVAFQTIEPWEEIPIDAIGPREYPAPAPDQAVPAEREIVNETTGETEIVAGIDYVRGKISNTRIYPGQVIVESQLIDKALEEDRLGLGSNASYIVPDGQVATTIPINDISSIAGALRAGDQVDIIAAITLDDPLNPESGEQEVVTQFLMQRVQILRVGPWTVAAEDDSQEETIGNLVTVLVTPQQALELKAIRETTAYEFVLRSITDDSEFVTEPVDLDYIIEQYNVRP